MMCGVILVSKEEQRKEWLSEVWELVHRTFPPYFMLHSQSLYREGTGGN